MRVAQKFVKFALPCCPFISLNYCIFQDQQIICTADTTEYVMTKGDDSVAIPVGGGMFPEQASHAQAAQSPIVLVPVSGGIGGQSTMVKVAPTTAIPGTVFVPQEAVKPPPYV